MGRTVEERDPGGTFVFIAKTEWADVDGNIRWVGLRLITL